MVKQVMKGIYEEEAPAIMINPKRYSHDNFSKLEPIIEEGYEKIEVVLPKRIMFLLPVILSFVSYFLLYRHM